jgi:hypothetical protein
VTSFLPRLSWRPVPARAATPARSSEQPRKAAAARQTLMKKRRRRSAPCRRAAMFSRISLYSVSLGSPYRDIAVFALREIPMRANARQRAWHSTVP